MFLRKSLNFILIGAGAAAIILFFVLPMTGPDTFSTDGFKGFDFDIMDHFLYMIGAIAIFAGAVALVLAGVFGLITKSPAKLLGTVAAFILVAGAVISFVYTAFLWEVTNPITGEGIPIADIEFVGIMVYICFGLGLVSGVLALVTPKE